MKFLTKSILVFVAISCMLIFTSCNLFPVRKDVQDDDKPVVGDVEIKTIEKKNPQEDIIVKKQENKDKEQEAIIKKEPETYIGEIVLMDENDIRIILRSLDMKGTLGPSLKVLVENNSDETIMVKTSDNVVNGVMQKFLFNCEVASGKRANDEIIIVQEDLDRAGIEKIKEIEFKLHVYKPETYDTIYDSEMITITTSVDPSYVQKYDDSGFLALDSNDIKIVIKKSVDKNDFWAAIVNVYVENNSDEDISVRIKELSVNGYMASPAFSCEVLAGKKAFDMILFTNNELSEIGVNSLENIELVFEVSNKETMETIVESDRIIISFENQ